MNKFRFPLAHATTYKNKIKNPIDFVALKKIEEKEEGQTKRKKRQMMDVYFVASMRLKFK